MWGCGLPEGGHPRHSYQVALKASSVLMAQLLAERRRLILMASASRAACASGRCGVCSPNTRLSPVGGGLTPGLHCALPRKGKDVGKHSQVIWQIFGLVEIRDF